MRGLAGWVGSHCSGRSARGILQQPGSSPWEVWGLNPKLASPAYSIRARKEPREHPAVKSSRISVLKGEMDGDTESLLKGQHTKFHLQPLTVGSRRGREEWTRDTWGESRVGGSRKELKDQLPGSLCSVIPHTTKAILLRQSIPL